jgi:acyl-CoA synthetase (NDP forming)
MAALRQILPQAAGIANPVDMIASATAAQYADAMRVVAQDAGIHALIVIFIPPLATHLEDAARAIAEAARDIVPHKPVLTVFMHSRGIPEVLRNAQVRLPSFAFPETAALALARATRYGEWLLRPQDAPAVFVDVRADEAAAIVAAALGRGVTWLEPQPLLDVLGCWGLPVVPQRTVSLVDDLRAAAESLGDTIALKGVADGLVHRSDAAAVMLSLRPDDVPAAAMRMREQLERHGYQPSGFIMQQMAPQGTEMIVGVVHDPQFGPVVACGAGGTLVELLRDVSVRLTPLASADAHEMVSELRSFPLLTGYRGSAPRDVAALEDIILRVSAMVEALPEIAELDLNPVLVHEAGASIVDARLRLAAVERAALPGEREWA